MGWSLTGVVLKISDIADAIKEFLDGLAGAPAPQPIPVRVKDGRPSPLR